MRHESCFPVGKTIETVRKFIGADIERWNCWDEVVSLLRSRTAGELAGDLMRKTVARIFGEYEAEAREANTLYPKWLVLWKEIERRGLTCRVEL